MVIMKGFRIKYRRDGNGSYRALQRPSDFLRSLVPGNEIGGRYKFTPEEDGSVTVSKRYGLSRKDVPLTETDINGLSSRDNKRFLRAFHRYFKGLEKKGEKAPDKMNFYVGTLDTRGNKIEPRDTKEEIETLFSRIPYARSGKRKKKEINSYNPAKIAGWASLPVIAAGVCANAVGSNEIGNALLTGGGMGALGGLYGWGAASNSDTNAEVRENTRDIERNYTGKTKNPKWPFKAYLTQFGDTKRHRIVDHDPENPLETPSSLKENEEVMYTIVARTERGLQRKINRMCRSFEKEGRNIVNQEL